MNTATIIMLITGAIEKLFDALTSAGATPEQIQAISEKEITRIRTQEKRYDAEEFAALEAIKTQDLP